jgi:hypothetical protein
MIGLQYYWERTKEADQRAKSIPYFQKACAAGEVRVACFNLGMLIQEGLLSGTDEEQAELFRKSCDVGHGLGCFNAGIVRSRAKTPKAKKAALSFFKRGCRAKHEPSCARRDELSKPPKGQHVPHPTMARANRSEIPTVSEWNAAAKVSMAGAAGSGCETKRVREWLRVSCRGKNAWSQGTPTGVRVDEGGKYDTYTFARGGVASVVVAVVEGTKLEASFMWSDGEVRQLVVSWPKGSPRPASPAAFVAP